MNTNTTKILLPTPSAVSSASCTVCHVGNIYGPPCCLADYCPRQIGRHEQTPALEVPVKVRTTIKRPSRYQQNRAGYELTVSGLVMGRAIAAVKNAEDTYTDVGASLQEGGAISSDTWDAVSSRYASARRKLATCRARISSGQTAAERTC